MTNGHRPQPPQPQHEPHNKTDRTDKPKGVDPKTGKDPSQPSGIDPNYNTKPAPDADGGGGGGDQSPHPSPATDPTNSPPEPAQWTKDNPRPPLPKGKDYVAGQPVSQEEYELTEKEAAERVRPEAWDRVEGAGGTLEEGMKDASTGWDEDARQRGRDDDDKARQARENKDETTGWDRNKEGTRPDARRLRDPNVKDDDVNKAPGGAGGQGTRADGRARSPDMPGEGPDSRGEGVRGGNIQRERGPAGHGQGHRQSDQDL